MNQHHPHIQTPHNFPAPTLPLYIDSSMLSTYKACKRKFEYAYINNYTPIGTNIHLAAGGAVAAGLEAARNAQFYSPVRLTTDELLQAAMRPYLRAWDNYLPSEDETKNHHNVFHALETYLTDFHPYDDSIQPVKLSNGKPGTEFTFAIPLPVLHPSGDPFIFVGRFDMLGLFHDLLVVLDDKTTGALGAWWQQQWHLRGQFLGYMWACRQLGYPVDHVVVRGICIQKTQHQYITVPVQFADHLITRWYEELLLTLQELVHYYNAKHFAYNFGDSCTSFGGCTYRDLCMSEELEPWLVNFEPRTWSPISADTGN